MTDDIVTRLRRDCMSLIADEAADEIERLRNALHDIIDNGHSEPISAKYARDILSGKVNPSGSPRCSLCGLGQRNLYYLDTCSSCLKDYGE